MDRVLKFFLLNLIFCCCDCLALAGSEAKHTKDIAKLDDSAWPMFRGGPDLRGVAGGEVSDSLKLLWTFKTGEAIKSSPTIANGRLYVGSNDQKIYAVELSTGKKLWSFKTEGAVEATPLVLNDVIYFGSADFNFYALDAMTGNKLWIYKSNDKILGSANWMTAPGSGEKWILFGGYDTSVYCLRAKTGEKVWSYETESYVNGTPAVFNKKVVFGGCDGLLYILNGMDGKKIKEVEIGAYIAGSAAVVDERAYLGHYGNKFVSTDISRGGIIWNYSHKNFPYFSSPAVGQGRVVFGGRDKSVHCVDQENGERIWLFRAGGHVDSSPIICGEKVIVGAGNGRLYILNLENGHVLWQYDIGQGIVSSPAVVGGKIYIGANDGILYAFGAR